MRAVCRQFSRLVDAHTYIPRLRKFYSPFLSNLHNLQSSACAILAWNFISTENLVVRAMSVSDLAKKQPGYKTLRKRLKSREKAIQVNLIGLILISIIIYLRTRKRITTQQLTTRHTRTRKATDSYDYFTLVSVRETKKKATLNSLNNKRKRDKNETKSLVSLFLCWPHRSSHNIFCLCVSQICLCFSKIERKTWEEETRFEWKVNSVQDIWPIWTS